MNDLGKFLLLKDYNCSTKDHENLETLQRQIQERITVLNEQNLESYNDPQLLEYYELYNQIQKCIFQDHTDQYLLIAGIIIGISFFVYFRWKMIKKRETNKNRFNFKN